MPNVLKLLCLFSRKEGRLSHKLFKKSKKVGGTRPFSSLEKPYYRIITNRTINKHLLSYLFLKKASLLLSFRKTREKEKSGKGTPNNRI